MAPSRPERWCDRWKRRQELERQRDELLVQRRDGEARRVIEAERAAGRGLQVEPRWLGEPVLRGFYSKTPRPKNYVSAES